MLLGHVELLQTGPHGLRDAHHVVHHHLVEEPDVPTHLRDLVQVRVQHHQGVLDEVYPLLREHELHHRHHVGLDLGHRFHFDGGLDDAGDGFEAAGSRQLGLSVIILLVGLLGVFAEQFEEEFGEVLDQFDGEGAYLVGEVFHYAF